MSDRLKYERFLWFHGQIKAGTCPNARMLAERFELTSRTAQRDIEFMRDRLLAPLQYSAGRKGYVYTDPSFELPRLRLTEENLISIALAVRLASSLPDAKMKESLCSFLDELLGRTGRPGICSSDAAELISVKNIEYSRVSAPFFPKIAESLLKTLPLEIRYSSPHTKETTTRIIVPLHLLLYMGSWHLIAYCSLKKGLRDFMVSRIASVTSYNVAITLPRNLPSPKEYVRKNFGIMQGGKGVQVKLRFSPAVSPWVREQVWHPGQRASAGKDGSMTLAFPAADFRELRRRILSYGADVKVLSPKALARDLREEIRRMAGIY